MARDRTGRFAPKAPTEPPEDPGMLSLTILPIDTPPPPPDQETPPSAGPDGWYRPDEPGAGAVPPPDDATPVATAIARGINELLGMALGDQYRGKPADVDAVGDAAEPVLRRGLDLVHAGGVVDRVVPAPFAELANLAAKAWVAWGDAWWLLVRQRVEALRAEREARDAASGTGGADGGAARRDDRAGGPGGDRAARPAAVPGDRGQAGPDRPAARAAGHGDQLAAAIASRHSGGPGTGGAGE